MRWYKFQFHLLAHIPLLPSTLVFGKRAVADFVGCNYTAFGDVGYHDVERSQILQSAGGCIAVPIMMDDDDFIDLLVDNKTSSPVKQIEDIPEGAKKFINSNEKYLKLMSVQDNKSWFKKERESVTSEEGRRILSLDREQQFNLLVEYRNGGKVMEHKLVTIRDDYADILRAAKELAKRGRTIEIMPEIPEREEIIRAVLFPDLRSKTSNPDIREEETNLYYDVKRPSAIKNIEGNANKASKQGAIVIISDSRLDKELTEKVMEVRAKDISNNPNYKEMIVLFLRKGKLHEYKSNRR